MNDRAPENPREKALCLFLLSILLKTVFSEHKTGLFYDCAQLMFVSRHVISVLHERKSGGPFVYGNTVCKSVQYAGQSIRFTSRYYHGSEATQAD